MYVYMCINKAFRNFKHRVKDSRSSIQPLGQEEFVPVISCTPLLFCNHYHACVCKLTSFPEMKCCVIHLS